MITGTVNAALEAVIPLVILDRLGQVQTVDAVIDTGFSATLFLPPALIAALNLGFLAQRLGTLADGSTHLFDVYEATIDWDGLHFRIEVGEADPTPLVGMGLMRDYRLEMDVRVGGPVALTAIP